MNRVVFNGWRFLMEKKLHHVEIIDSNGFPLIVFDFEKMDLDLDSMKSDKQVFSSSLLVVAIQGLDATGKLFNVVESEKEKFLVIKKEDISLVLALDPDVDIYDAKIHLFARSLLAAYIKLMDKLDISLDFLTVDDYIKKVREPFRRLVIRLLEKIGLV